MRKWVIVAFVVLFLFYHYMYRSSVTFNHEKVTKRFMGHSKNSASGLNAEQSFLLEVECLSRLEGSKHFPKILSVDRAGMAIVMTNQGTSLDKLRRRVRVANYEDQIRDMCKQLADQNTCHLDVLPKNVCVSESGILSLIDFDVASVDGLCPTPELEERMRKLQNKGGHGPVINRILNEHGWLDLRGS
jgi:RIO-like serine/threonine protein kinase